MSFSYFSRVLFKGTFYPVVDFCPSIVHPRGGGKKYMKTREKEGKERKKEKKKEKKKRKSSESRWCVRPLLCVPSLCPKSRQYTRSECLHSE
jgi:hypothetical protein